MADSEVPNNIIFEIIVDGDGSQSLTNILDSNDYNISETVLNNDITQSVTNILTCNNYVISDTISNDDEPQSTTNAHNSNDNIISEIVFSEDEPQIMKNIFNSNNYVIPDSISNDDEPQSTTNVLNSNNIISVTVLNDDEPQIVKNIFNSNNYVISDTISNDDEPQSTINVLNSNVNIISEAIVNDNRPQNMTNILNFNDFNISETKLNDDGTQNVTNVLTCNNYVISDTISNDSKPQSIINVLNSNDHIISEAIVNGDGPQNVKNVLNSNNYIISNDDELQSTTKVLNSNDDIISEAILNDDGQQIVKNVLNSNNYIISKDDGPQTTTNVLNSNDNSISETIFNNDRPNIASNNLIANDNIISEVTFDNDRPQTVSSILNFNDDRTTAEICNVNSDSMNIKKAVNNSPSHLEKDSFNDTKVNLKVPLTDQSLINGLHEDFEIGDIVWAKIGKYPFWPSIVCFDPESNTYFRKKKKIWFHVRFCNDKGRRSWTKTIESYCGKNKLLTKYPNCLTYIKNSEKLMDTWNFAVKEADNLLKLNKEARIVEFMKTFSKFDDVDSVASSTSNNYSEGTVATLNVRTYSRKRSRTVPEQDSIVIKTEKISVNGSTSSRSIDIPLLSRSDDADSTVSDISMNHIYMEDTGLKTKEEITKKRKSTKTYPPKSSFTPKYDFSDSKETSLRESGNNLLLSDNHGKITGKAMTLTRSVPGHRKLEVSVLEGDYEQDNIISTNTCRSSKKIEILKNLPNSKKTVLKRKRLGKESSTGRKSTTTKSESSPEPDTTESEASSKNDTYSSVFLASTKNKQLFVKNLKKACVVCKNSENTIKCMGPCQSYFHEECFTKSEERYRKSEPKIVIQNKKHGRRKKHYSKCTSKKRDSIVSVKQVINNTNEEDIVKSYEKNGTTSKSINGLNSLLKKQSSDCTDENELLENSKSDGLSIDKNCVFTTNVNNQRLSELEIANKESIPEISEKSIITSTKSVTNEKSSKNDLKYMCSLCRANKTYCFVCGLDIQDNGQKIMCKMPSCGKYYHEHCLRDWPQCQWIQGLRNNVRCVVCPHHVCHLCISDNPKSSCKTHFPGEKLCRCIKCPTAYHRSEYCLPAGSQVLTYFDIICSRHFEPLKLQNYHYNAPWCFICTLGGTLICCDLCPSSFHIECLNQNPSEFEDGFTCEECQTGRYPLYGEIVWVKIGQYRWWPAQIIFPNQVPDSVNSIAHSVGQFAVRFFGTYDYYWVNRGRVFNFHEGDDENILKKNKMKVIDLVFQDAIIEAAQAHNSYIIDKDKNDALVAKKTTKPPKFVRIKFNKPIGNVKNIEFDCTTMTPCECDPTKPNPCGPGSDCINRMLMFECQPQLCPAGDKCNNQRFEKTLYPAMVPFLTKDRGWGLKTLEDIKEGSFIIEYVGDVIDEEEFQRRCLEMHQRNEQNYYFLTIDNSRMIDAGPKGNLSRFMNHSCEPNCVTQKWTVNGDTRIGLFALHDIPRDTELVFDYRLQSCSGVEKKPCQCGAARCSRFIGVKVEEEKKKLISTNDADKCKTTTKNKRKPLKMKDNVSDSDKSKLSKVSKNDQNISVTGNEVYVSNVEKIFDSKKSKMKLSIGKQSAILKNENSESSIKPVIKRKWKKSKKNNTNTTKDDNTVNSSKSEEFIKLKKSMSKLPSKKQLIKKNVFKTSLLPLPNNYAEVSNLSTLCTSESKGHVDVLKNIEDMKMTRIPVDSTNDLMKTEQFHEVLNNAPVNISNGCTEIQERSRHSLSRLAKSRHSFLSKNNSNKEKNEDPVLSKKKFNKDKVITKMKHREISFIKNSLIKKTKMNTQHLQTKTYYKNDSCMICNKGHAELTCKNKKCLRVFHLSCMNKTRIAKSGFICPSHFCSVCKKRKVVAKCKFCIESFCITHVKGNIFKDPLGNGMLCCTHQPNKKQLSIASSSVTSCSSVNSKLNVTNLNTETESIDFVDSNLSIAQTENLPRVDEDNLNLDEINEEKYNVMQVVKDEGDREYIHIGGFNVYNMSEMVTDHQERYTVPVDTDGDLFKPSSANVVIDIESASALYQPTDSLELGSITTESKDSHDYANVHFIPDASQTKNKWLAAEP